MGILSRPDQPRQEKNENRVTLVSSANDLYVPLCVLTRFGQIREFSQMDKNEQKSLGSQFDSLDLSVHVYLHKGYFALWDFSLQDVSHFDQDMRALHYGLFTLWHFSLQKGFNFWGFNLRWGTIIIILFWISGFILPSTGT